MWLNVWSLKYHSIYFIGKNEVKQNKMHLKAEKRRKEMVESSSYKVNVVHLLVRISEESGNAAQFSL